MEVVYVVWVLCDLVDSVWDTEEAAQARVNDLSDKWGTDWPFYREVKLNTPGDNA